MTKLLKAMGSEEKRNNDLVHADGVPPNPSLERTSTCVALGPLSSNVRPRNQKSPAR
jgi:hypothetical protein